MSSIEFEEGTLKLTLQVIDKALAKKIATRIQRDSSYPVHCLELLRCKFTRWKEVDETILKVIAEGNSSVHTVSLKFMELNRSVVKGLCDCLKAKKLHGLRLYNPALMEYGANRGYDAIANVLVDSDLVHLEVIDFNQIYDRVIKSLPLTLESLRIAGYWYSDLKCLQNILCYGKLGELVLEGGCQVGFSYRQDIDEFLGILSRSTVEILRIANYDTLYRFLASDFPASLKEFHLLTSECTHARSVADMLLRQTNSRLRVFHIPFDMCWCSGKCELYTALVKVAQQLPSIHTIKSCSAWDDDLDDLIMMLHAQRVCEVLVSPSVIGRLSKGVHLPVDVLMFWLVPMMTGVNPWKRKQLLLL